MTTIESIGYGNIIPIDTSSPLLNFDNITVILSSTSLTEKYTILDIGGNLSFFSPNSPSSLIISTSLGTSFLDGTTSLQMTLPYSKVSCFQVTPTLWEVIGSETITDESHPILSTLNVNGNATILSTCYVSTVMNEYIYCYGTVFASSITQNGILYASISTISSAINTLEVTTPFNYISISTMSSVMISASNAPYYYINLPIYQQSSLLLSTTTYTYITVASLQKALGNLSSIPGCLSSISYSYLNNCTPVNYVYARSSLFTTASVRDIPKGVIVSAVSDPGGLTSNIWYSDRFITNQMYGNAAGIDGIPSDISLKRDITDLVSSLDLLQSLQGVSYKMKDRESSQIGFIAQEMENVFPEIVHEDMSEYKIKGIRYYELLAPIVEAMKELDERISVLEREL
jgi:hypothetical protein